VNIKDIRNTLVDHLYSDADILAYCSATFGVDHPTVFGAINLADPPKEGDAPYIAIESGERARSADNHYLVHQLYLTVNVVEDTLPKDDPGGKITFASRGACDELAALVERSASRFLADNGIPITMTPGMEDYMVFPWCSASWVYEIRIRDIL
jgi:hypothetical protein